MDLQSRRLTLLEWFVEHHITFDSTALDLKADPSLYSGRALGVFAKRDLEEGKVLVTIPKSAVLSVRNTSLAAFLEEHRIGGGLGLVFAVMHEVALGQDSPWHNYFQSLPPREYVPLFWSASELALLEGTDAASKAEADRMDTAEDFKNEIAPLLSKGSGLFNPAKMTLEAFRIAASWIGSRAFGVDDFHGMALVPFADIFNHKASILALSADYVLERACLASDQDLASSSSEDELAEDASQEGVCEDKSSESGAEQGIEQQMPLISAVTRGSMLDALLFPEQDLRLHIGICGATRDGQEVLEIIAACPLVAGQEIFNAFGELGNAELVTKYGFALPDNPFTTVHLEERKVEHHAELLLGKVECKRRCRYLHQHSDLLDSEEEPMEVLPCGQLGLPLLVAARVLGCSNSEFAAIKKLPLADALDTLLPRTPSNCKEQTPETESLPVAKRQKITTGSSAATSEATSSLPHQISDADKEAQDLGANEQTLAQEKSLGNTIIRDADPCWLPTSVCKLLLAILRGRLEHYPEASIVKDKQALQKVQAVNPREESHAAQIAALTLAIQEKQILRDAIDALENKSTQKPYTRHETGKPWSP